MNDNITPSPQSTPAPAAQATFWQRYGTTTIRLGIVAVIIIGAVIYSKTQFNEPSTDSKKDTSATAPTSTLPIANTPAATSTPNAPKNAPTAQAPTVSGGTITVTAIRGNGYTHLARRALKAYVESAASKPQLKPEHKIYIEDYLQKRLNKRTHLTTGTDVVFAQADIQQAIDRSLNLTDRQLQNLHRYTLRVKNL